MKTSRVSKETARVFQRTSSLSPPRRVTRGSLSRFAHPSPSATRTTASHKISNGVADIEDALERPAKRRRKNTSASSPSFIKSELVEEAVLTLPASPSKSSPRRVRKPARKTGVDGNTGEPIIAPPSDWEVMYKGLVKMRSPGGRAHAAPVDTVGCERLADPTASERDQRLHTLVALMLSSQTKDTVNAVAMGRLKNELPPHKKGASAGLNLENLLAVDDKLLNQLIWQVGFHNNKTKYLKQTAKVLRDSWDGDIPDTIDGLVSLPGVGPKMAYLCLSAAWDKTEGIGVDVHVHRITNMWGWHKTKNPEETRLALESWLPRDKWREINVLLVGLGQTVCLPVGRKCGECELGIDGHCKAAERKKVLDGRRVLKRETVLVKEENADSDDEKTVVKAETVKLEDEVLVTKHEQVVNESVTGASDSKS